MSLNNYTFKLIYPVLGTFKADVFLYSLLNVSIWTAEVNLPYLLSKFVFVGRAFIFYFR